MSNTIVTAHSHNVHSLGSTHDYFVVQHSTATNDPSIEVLPKILARVYDPELALIAVRHYRERAKSLGHNNWVFESYSYREMQSIMDNYGHRILSLNDTFYDKKYN